MNINEISDLISLKLEENFSDLQKQYFDAKKKTSTKFFFLDNLLPEKLIIEIYESLPEENLFLRNTFREKKLTLMKLKELPNPLLENVMDAFHADNVVKIISKLTEIDDLYTDPELYKGQIFRMNKGHFVNPHIDNSHDTNKKKYRRLNVLFYFTPNIQESDGGNFELWDDKVKTPLKICSKFNRLVVMETTRYSWHSVDPVKTNILRCCISNYFFSKNSPDSPTKDEYFHVTSFLGRPKQKFRRFYGRIDNTLRNSFVKYTRFSRSKP